MSVINVFFSFLIFIKDNPIQKDSTDSKISTMKNDNDNQNFPTFDSQVDNFLLISEKVKIHFDQCPN